MKHAVTRKHGPESANKKGSSEFYMELSTEDQEAFANAEAHFLAAEQQRTDDRSRFAQHHKAGRGELSGFHIDQIFDLIGNGVLYVLFTFSHGIKPTISPSPGSL